MRPRRGKGWAFRAAPRFFAPVFEREGEGEGEREGVLRVAAARPAATANRARESWNALALENRGEKLGAGKVGVRCFSGIVPL